MEAKGWIAVDQGGREHWATIYGFGDTVAEAQENARFFHSYFNPDAMSETVCFDVLPATAALIASAMELGGEEVEWDVTDDGLAALSAEIMEWEKENEHIARLGEERD